VVLMGFKLPRLLLLLLLGFFSLLVHVSLGDVTLRLILALHLGSARLLLVLCDGLTLTFSKVLIWFDGFLPLLLAQRLLRLHLWLFWLLLLLLQWLLLLGYFLVLVWAVMHRFSQLVVLFESTLASRLLLQQGLQTLRPLFQTGGILARDQTSIHHHFRFLWGEHSKRAPAFSSSDWSRKGTALSRPYCCSSLLVKQVRRFPSTKFLPLLNLARTNPAGPWQMPAMIPSFS